MPNKSASTPGPWEYYDEEGYNFGIGNKEGRHVADVSHNANIPTEEKRANARLIAAAPDFAEAARLAAAVLSEHVRYDDPQESLSREAVALNALLIAQRKAGLL